MIALILALSFGTSVAASASPSPTPSPSPVPAYTLDGAFSAFTAHSNGANAAGALDTASGADDTTRTDVGNALLVFAKNTGEIRFGFTAGAYAFPVVGQPLNPAARQPGANTDLFGVLPLVDVAYVPNAHVTISAGKLGTLLGQESIFTYQNLNIQRGLAWNAEPVLSRGVRFAYAQGKFIGDLEFDDGYYSGSGRAVEGLAGWQASPTTNLQFAWITPGRATPGNATSAIANKSEYDVMVTQQFGKLQLLPYALFVDSPAASTLGYTKNERALALVALANYSLSAMYSIAGRYESFANRSATNDGSLNADFLGYGPGSSAASWTITPAYKGPNDLFLRAEYSSVRAKNIAPGLGFGPGGTSGTQTRVLVEFGVEF